MTTLITGGTGNIGGAFVREHARRLAPGELRIATRRPDGDAARALAATHPNVRPIGFDIDDDASVRAACEGVTHVLVVAPFLPEMEPWHQKLADGLVAAGDVQHVVKVSVTGARDPASTPGDPPGRIPLQHWLGEQALRDAGLPVTALRPTMFMQHFLTMPALYARGEDAFYLPTEDTALALLDCRDLAAFAMALLDLDAEARQAHLGKAYELTGPSAVDAAGISAILTAVARRPIRHVGEEQAFDAHAASLGVSALIKNVYVEARQGWFSGVHTAEFDNLVGRRPTSFAQFALDHTYWFR